MPITIAPIALRHASGFHACLDGVAREKLYLAQVEALPLSRIEAFIQDSVSNDAAQFVALDGEWVVGWADIFPHWAPALAHCGTLGMGLLPSHRGQGLGRQLLTACISKAGAKGITRIELEARADNHRAIRLYEQLGFVHETRKKCAMRFDGVYHDAAQMSLLLASTIVPTILPAMVPTILPAMVPTILPSLAPTTTEADIRALEHQRVQSLLQRDMPTAWRLHAPDYQLITPSGVSFSRERYLGMVEAGSLVYLQWQAEAMQVRLRGNMAVVRYPATLQLAAGSAFRCWHTDTYEQTDGRWQAVWSQATAIRSD